jgi:hypothetical protein
MKLASSPESATTAGEKTISSTFRLARLLEFCPDIGWHFRYFRDVVFPFAIR